MDNTIIEQLELTEENDVALANYVEECLEVYRQTQDALGVFINEPLSQAMDNYSVDYKDNPSMDAYYGHIRVDY
ncbi:MAG: hypothetical protein WC476_12410 [Phycisphaerae bacterium]|jgi:hypothetical protein